MGLFNFRKRYKESTADETQNPEIVEESMDLREIALTAPEQPRRVHAVEQLTDQETLSIVARQDENEYVRAVAIRKLKRARTLLEIALQDRSQRNRAAAVEQYCEVMNPVTFIRQMEELTGGDREQIARAARILPIEHLETVLNSIEDPKFVRMMMPERDTDLAYVEKMRWEQLCFSRIETLEQQAGMRKAQKLTTDAERAEFVLSSAEKADVRVEVVRQITDDELLADIIAKGEYSDIRKAAAETIRDGSLLTEALKRLWQDHKLFKEVVCEVLEDVNNRDVLRIVAADESVSWSVRMAALERIGDQKLLGEAALHAEDDDRLKAVKLLEDRGVLAQVAEGEDNDLHLRWCAAWRLGDRASMSKIEGLAKKHVNGHALIVTKHTDWVCHEELCIRCGKVGGREDDSESTRHYGIIFSSTPCQPDFPKL